MMKLLVTLLGLFGIFAVVVLTVFFTITAAVSTPGPVELTMMAANALPFLFYVLFTLRNWPKTLGIKLGIPLHFVWLPPIVLSANEGNFEIPLFLIVSFAIYVFYVRSMRVA